MNLQQVTSQATSAAQNGVADLTRPKSTPGSAPAQLPFISLVQDMVGNIDAQQHQVAFDVDKLAKGEADNLQAIAVNVAKADLSFRFLMEVRDKLISSYQDVMRMQV